MEVRSCGADVWWASHDGAQLRSAKDLLLAVALATAALRFYLRSCTYAPPCLVERWLSCLFGVTRVRFARQVRVT